MIYEVTIYFGRGIQTIPPYRIEAETPCAAVKRALDIENVAALDLASAGGRVKVDEPD